MYADTSYEFEGPLGHFSLVPGQPVEPSDIGPLTVMHRRAPNWVKWWDIEYPPPGVNQSDYPVE